MHRALLLLLVIVLAAAVAPAPDAPLNDETTPEGWIWRQIQAGNDVDFNARCGTERLDPHTSDDPRWAENCRAVSPAALRALISRPDLTDIAPHGVRLRGARIDGTLNLDDVHVTAAEFTLIDSSLAGDLLLTTAHLDGELAIDGTVITGRLAASGAHVDRGITIEEKASIGREVELDVATLGDALTVQDATLAGGMNVTGTQIGSFLVLSGGEIDGDVALVATKVRGEFIIDGMKFSGGKALDFTGLEVRGFLVMHNSQFTGEVILASASVTGSFAMDGVTFESEKPLNAAGLQVGALMTMLNVMLDGVILDSANVHDNFAISNAKFAAAAQLSAAGLRVGGTLRLLTPTVVPGGVDLDNANIGRDLIMDGVDVGAGKTFSAGGLRVDGVLNLGNAEFGGDVNLAGANIRGQFNLNDSKLAPTATLSVEGLHAGQDALWRDLRATRPIDAMFLAVSGSLDLRGARLGGIDLSGAVVGGDLRLGGRYDKGEEAWTQWASPDNAKPLVVLRNAKVGNLQDDERSWNGTELVLEGFNYLHLGGVGGVNRQDMCYRSVKSWRNWLARDPIYSPQPYTQLASVLMASGNSDAATEIRFAGRDRERNELLQNCYWLHPSNRPAGEPQQRRCNLGGWVGLSVLQVVIGYGIGTYTFRALWWTLGLALVGTTILLFAPGVRDPAQYADGHRRRPTETLLWCFGASLNHVLPVVTLSPEFTDFFNDPERKRFRAWQQIAFAVLALCGWALSFFLVAALSGLTQN